MKNLLSIQQLTHENIISIMELSEKLKNDVKNNILHQHLKGKSLGMIFTKASTRTRISFEVGMYQLGGNAIFLNSSDLQLGRGETIKDTAEVLSRYLDAIMIRTFDHKDVEELAKYSTIPIINGLTDLYHPCQALADVFTIFEYKKTFHNIKVAYIGDGNNVAHSLLNACAKLGINISVATPVGYECAENIVKVALDDARKNNSTVLITNDLHEAASDADFIYTDTCVSMGQEKEKADKLSAFSDYIINNRIMQLARPTAKFMHCLPAYRNVEVTTEVLEGPQSIVMDQAENRLHVQKAILTLLMGRNEI